MSGRRKILVVDDDPDLLLLLRITLAAEDLEPSLASRSSRTSCLFIRNSSRSSGPKPLVHSTAPNTARIAGIPRIS